METADIQRRWLKFFEERDHTVVPSASLVSDDPTLMFTVAGMVPFIPFLTGVVPAPYARATSVQKCIRTLDIEEVGQTTRHGTFFQMNGNFSFGDYFKREAIEYAWEFLTSETSKGGLGFSERDLWVTVYEEDEEAEKLWKEVAEVPAQRIQRLGRADNYWTTGQPGPAGPCSEIYFDRGKKFGAPGGPAVDDTRYLEIWNLVFMQYSIENVRSKTDFDVVGELPQKNIDTGMGMERVAFLKQGVDNMYEIDQVRPVLNAAAEIAGKKYGDSHQDDIRLRVIADHIRSSLMLMADGISPSNDGRGYVLRRLLRRSVRAMRLLGVSEPSFEVLMAASRDAMSDAYPEILDQYGRVSQQAVSEEDSFLRTLEAGTSILDVAVTDAQKKSQKHLTGETAFLLHDTYGFPIDLTLEVAEESGLTVNRGEFDALMESQRQRAKSDAKSKRALRADLTVYSDFRAKGETVFVGYENFDVESVVIGIISDGVSVSSAGAGKKVELVLRESPLYAESGGQLADHGLIQTDGALATVLDVQRPVQGLISHLIEIDSGEISVGEKVLARVDRLNRYEAARAHSATHLIHAALREVLGSQAVQAGSLNRAGYLRLDFSWNKPLTDEVEQSIEKVVNDAIRDDLLVETRVLPLTEARSLGAMALFGEKYGDTVRMVDIGGSWSRELCAGTHVERASQIGAISITGETSISSTARRIEAFVGGAAVENFSSEKILVRNLTQLLKAPREDVAGRIADLVQQVRDLEKKVRESAARDRKGRIPGLVNLVQKGPVSSVVSIVNDVNDADELRSMASDVLAALGKESNVVALGAAFGDRATIVVTANPSAVGRGIDSGQLVKEASSVLGGKGGGKATLAQGGGPDGSRLASALEGVSRTLGEIR